MFVTCFNYKAQVKASPKADIKVKEKSRQNNAINMSHIYLSVKEEEKETPEDMS